MNLEGGGQQVPVDGQKMSGFSINALKDTFLF